MYQMTLSSTNGGAVSGHVAMSVSCDRNCHQRLRRPYEIWYNFDTVKISFSRQGHQIELISDAINLKMFKLQPITPSSLP